jgi:hypothetical protein
LPSLHARSEAGLHTPPLHTSPRVQPSPSLHTKALAVYTQPLFGEQLSVVHGLLSPHSVAEPARHTPPLHWSPAVQRLSSLHAAVSSALAWQPSLASQKSWVQGFLSSQLLAAPGWQLPPPH